MPAVNNRLCTIAAFGMAVHLVILFTIVVPTHYHADQHAHADCAICLVAHQPARTAAIFVLILAVMGVVAVVVAPEAIRMLPASAPFQSRAPPVL